LKELKIRTTNECKVDRAMFQSDWVLTQLKTTNGDTIRQ
jgi:hypothetical protein